jgi:hypothetical protein
MAQQQQQRPIVPRQHSAPPNATEAVHVPPAPRHRAIEASQEWILFSPAQDEEASVTATHTSHTPRTATHISDFGGSLETHVRSQLQRSDASTGVRIDTISDAGDDLDGDDAEELDSLDDGLYAFHHPYSATSLPHLDASGGAVLPTHDGFGTFPSGQDLQEQLWQFERYNPRRRTGRQAPRRSSAQRKPEAVEEEETRQIDLGGVVTEDDRTARVEKWRLDQSRAVLEEIERETRRMRRRVARMNSAPGTESILRASAASSRHPAAPEASTPPDGESFWRRITRRVIRDLIGLDESALSVIFGETFVQDDGSSTFATRREIDPESIDATPTQRSPLADALDASTRASRRAESWELRLLDTIARELGILVHQLSDHNNEGAFSTYKRMQAMPLEYAGMKIPRQPSLRSTRRPAPGQVATGDEPASDTLFVPTVPQDVLTPDTEPGDTSLWGIEEEPEDGGDTSREREYWEQEVDIKMIFNYLKRRFSVGPSTSPPPASATSAARLPHPNGPILPPSWAAASNSAGLAASSLSTAESVRRAEVIRRHHPLVSRAAAKQQQHQSSVLRRHHALQRRAIIGGGLASGGGGGGSSSCASQSTKRSRTASSRHYWGSVSGRSAGGAAGTGGGALGNWGEV